MASIHRTKLLKEYLTAEADFLKWLWGPYAGGSTERPWHVLEWSRLLGDSMGKTF